MNKKILIGSIIAVAILISISFTSVVGYQSSSRTIANASPLFTVRSSRALDVNCKDLSYNYVGKGEENIIPLQKRNDRIELLQKAIDLIRRMDDTNYKSYLTLIINHIQRNNEKEDLDINELKNTINQLRNSPEELKDYFIDGCNGSYPLAITYGLFCIILWGIFDYILLAAATIIFSAILNLCDTVVCIN